ncbi:MAG: hypothetical protein CME68_03785 [Halobacteriovoraceae bacterium]|nr:hypothetical protein [Halobacteriovoraceae bacterium]|tara:strand:+ start:1008 stop:1331 length:324 start_codon:yes stop_codon:yes gene_type:complete
MNDLKEGLSPLKKSAVVLSILGEDVCQKVFSHLKDSAVRKLIIEMRSIKKVPIKLSTALLREFYKALSETDELLFNNEEFFFQFSKNNKEKRDLVNYARNLDSHLKR